MNNVSSKKRNKYIKDSMTDTGVKIKMSCSSLS